MTIQEFTQNKAAAEQYRLSKRIGAICILLDLLAEASPARDSTVPETVEASALLNAYKSGFARACQCIEQFDELAKRAQEAAEEAPEKEVSEDEMARNIEPFN